MIDNDRSRCLAFHRIAAAAIEGNCTGALAGIRDRREGPIFQTLPKNAEEPLPMSLATSVSVEPASARSLSAESFDPILLSVLSSRIESIIREMTNTVMKASRSSVMKNARDMSCGILTYDNRLVCVEEPLPIHVTALELTTRPIVELFDDIEEGDAYLNNSPFYGGTHH